ncbi:MFS transporter [Orrella marina]|nr:MFS transporter [Orrella marina]
MTTPTRPWIILSATLAIQALVAMALITLPVVAPVVGQAINLSPAYVGVYVAFVYVAAMTSSILGGSLVRRWGALRVSQIGMCFSATGLALCAVAHPVSMALGAVLIGLGYGPVTPASSHLLIKTTPPERMSLVFSIKQTGVPVGGMMAGMLVPSFEVLVGWQAAFMIVCAMCLLLVVLVGPLRPVLDDDRDPTIRPSLVNSFVAPIKLVLKTKSLRILAAVSFMFSVTQLSVTTYMVTFLYEDLGWSLVAAGVALTVAQAAGVGGRILWGWVADNWLGSGIMLILVAALLGVSAIGLALFTSATPHWVLYLVLITIGSTAIGWNGVFLAEVARQAPHGMAGMATGGALGFTFMGVLFGPPIFGAAASTLHSYGSGYALLVVPASIIVVLLWRSRARWKNSRAT